MARATLREPKGGTDHGADADPGRLDWICPVEFAEE